MPRRRGVEIDLIGPDAKAPHRLQRAAASSSAASTWVRDRMPSTSAVAISRSSERPIRRTGRAGRPDRPKGLQGAVGVGVDILQKKARGVVCAMVDPFLCISAALHQCAWSQDRRNARCP
jgi:hypothetical protein